MAETLTARRFRRYVKGHDIMQKVVIPAFKRIECGGHWEKLDKCGRQISVANCCACHTTHFQGFDRCKSKWCVPCSSVKTKIWLCKLVPSLQEQLQQGMVISLLTLTMKDFEIGSLEEMLEQLKHAWEIMTHGRGNRKSWKDKVLGGVRNIEVKIGKGSGKWHAHYHCLLIHRPGRFYEWLKREWKKATSLAMKTEMEVGSVDIRVIETSMGLGKGVIEVVKYPMKPEKALWGNLGALEEAYHVLHGKRQTQTWGSLRKLASEVEKENEVDEKKLDRFICQACGCSEAELKKMMYDAIVEDGMLLADIEYGKMF